MSIFKIKLKKFNKIPNNYVNSNKFVYNLIYIDIIIKSNSKI